MCLNRLNAAGEDAHIPHGILNDLWKKGDTNDNSNVVDGYARAGLNDAIAAGDAAWYRGNRSQATRPWRASAKAAGERGMLYNQSQTLFRPTEVDCLPADQTGPDLTALLAQLASNAPDLVTGRRFSRRYSSASVNRRVVVSNRLARTEARTR